ncbi:MAG: porin [Holosporaceae bacterium]|jgi:predicted porin|nr:porin [Holosporaceae bacterium]
MSRYSIVVLLTLVFGTMASGCFGTPGKQPVSEEEVNFLNEIMSEKLRKAGIDTNFSFSGNSNMTVCLINQAAVGNKMPETFSYKGNIYLRYDNKTSDLGFGLEIGTKQKSGLMKQGNPICDSSFLYFESDSIGKIKIGYTNTAADAFCIKGDSVYVGYQGPGSGDLGAFYNVSAGALVDSDFFANDANALKIAWISPTISGMSLGVSFTPDSKSANLFRTRKSLSGLTIDDGWDFAHTTAFSKNVVTAGIAYEYGIPDDFNMKVSVAGWLGKGESSKNFSSISVNNVKAYNVGLVLGYKNFKMAAGFLDGGQSLLAKRFATEEDATPFDPEAVYDIHNLAIGIKEGADAGKVYSVGLAYKFGKWTLSGGYFRSSTKFSHSEKATAEVVTVAVSYVFNKVMSVYFEYDDIKTQTCDRAMKYKKACNLNCNPDNRASVFMIGTCINF